MKITSDIHVHTSLSLCARRDASLEGYLVQAQEHQITTLGFSDHFWDDGLPGANDFYRPQNYAHVASLLPEIEKARKEHPELKIYFGCECEYDPYLHGVACREEVAEQFDFMLVPNSHTHMMMPKACYHPYEKHAEFMLRAYEEILTCPLAGYVTSMAHPFEAVCCPYNNGLLIDMIPDDRYKRLFSLQARAGIAFEINVSAMEGKTHEEIEALSQIRIFRLAKECGVKFTFGSDAHSHTAHRYWDNTDFVSDLIGLRQEDLAEIART